jgi:hypothetical protein
MAVAEVDGEHLKDVAEAVRDKQCILFLGSGVHAGPGPNSPYTYPEEDRPLPAEQLAQELAAAIKLDARYPDESTKNLQRMSLFFEIEKKSRPDLVAEVQRAVHIGKKPSPVLRALAELPFPLVVTTNYDKLFERALVLAEKYPRTEIYDKEGRRETADFRDLNADEPFLLKIHGDVERPESIVVTDEDYIDFVLRMSDKEPYNPMPPAFTYHFRIWKTLFVGYSLVDYNLRLLFKTIRWTGDKANMADTFSVDFEPDPLIRDVYETQNRWVRFIVDDVWRFVPELYRLVRGEAMPDYRH